MTKRARSRIATWLPAALAVLASIAAPCGVQAYAAAKPELVLRKGDRIILIGNTFAERMQYFGHFETLLARPLSRARAGGPQPGLFGRRADTAAAPGPLQRSRAHAQGREAGRADCRIRLQRVVRRDRPGFAKFKKDLESFIKTSTTTKYNGKEPPRLVLFSPIAQEDLKNPHITDGKKNNVNIELYSRAMEELAAKHGAVFVDLFGPSKQLYESSDQPLTINGVHLSDLGYKRLAPIMMDSALRRGAELERRPI